jgi:type II secretory pathway component PulM
LIAALRTWWLGLARRERIATASGSAFALAAIVFLVAIEPAWRTRERLANELPRLRAQAAQVEALRLEARRLKERGVRFDNPQSLRAAATKLIAARNLPADALRSGEGDGMVLALHSVEASNCLGVLKELSSELPLRISSARITRISAGMVDAEVSLMPVKPQ